MTLLNDNVERSGSVTVDESAIWSLPTMLNDSRMTEYNPRR